MLVNSFLDFLSCALNGPYSERVKKGTQGPELLFWFLCYPKAYISNTMALWPQLKDPKHNYMASGGFNNPLNS